MTLWRLRDKLPRKILIYSEGEALVTKFVCGFLLALPLALLVPRADAVEMLSAQELVSRCEAFPSARDGVDYDYCVPHIQRFIDGAVTTDERVIMNMEADIGVIDFIADRALRTRLLSRPVSERAAGYAEFRFGGSVPFMDVVTTMVEGINSSPDKLAGAVRCAASESLPANYPCQDN